MKQHSRFAMLALAVGLAACGTIKPPPVALSSTDPEVPVTPGLMAAVEQSMKAVVTDPYSVQFDGVFAKQARDKTIYVCGQMNSKNQFGGYVGFRYFASLASPTSAGWVASPPIIGDAQTGEMAFIQMFPGCVNRR